METRTAGQRLLAGGSAAVAGLTTGVYVAVIREQGDDPFWEIFPWVAIMLIGALLAAASAVAGMKPVGRFAAAAATVVLGLLGLVAIFSVGLGFLLAAGLAFTAAVVPAARPTPVA